MLVSVKGVGCGYYRMKDQDIIQIQSSNYGIDNYNHDDACVWKFYGENCGVSATCPCFDVPSSFKCFGDYLKISDVPIYDQKFCGETSPQGIYRSVTGHFRIRFRSDNRSTGKGFLCYVSCTAPGKADPTLPTQECFKDCIPGGMAETSSDTLPVCPIGSDLTLKKAISSNTTQKIQVEKIDWKPISETRKI